MMTGMLIAILAYRPIYDSMFKSVNLENKTVAANGITEKRTAKFTMTLLQTALLPSIKKRFTQMEL
jgi:hypothetical protein